MASAINRKPRRRSSCPVGTRSTSRCRGRWPSYARRNRGTVLRTSAHRLLTPTCIAPRAAAPTGPHELVGPMRPPSHGARRSCRAVADTSARPARHAGDHSAGAADLEPRRDTAPRDAAKDHTHLPRARSADFVAAQGIPRVNADADDLLPGRSWCRRPSVSSVRTGAPSSRAPLTRGRIASEV